jgi:hypothetical protein
MEGAGLFNRPGSPAFPEIIAFHSSSGCDRKPNYLSWNRLVWRAISHQTHPPSCVFTIQVNFLALVGDGSAALSPPSWAAAWKTLAIPPGWAQPKATALLPLPLSTRLANFWNHSVQEAVPAVLAAARITPERPRIFISYKRDETQGFANQLFHGLAEAQFDVFLDHYRIPAGVELLARIRHELGPF